MLPVMEAGSGRLDLGVCRYTDGWKAPAAIRRGYFGLRDPSRF